MLLYDDEPVVTVSLKYVLLGMLEWMKSLTNNRIIMCGYNSSVAVACGARLSCSVFVVYSVLLSVSLMASAPI